MGILLNITEITTATKDVTGLILSIVALLTAMGGLVELLSKNHSPLAWIGRRINKDLYTSFDEIITRLDKIEEKELKKDLQDKRNYILDFANTLRQGKKHAVEEFDHAIELIDEYHELCEKHKIENGVIDVQSKYIVSEYMRLSRDGSFKDKIKSGDLL